MWIKKKYKESSHRVSLVSNVKLVASHFVLEICRATYMHVGVSAFYSVNDSLNTM